MTFRYQNVCLEGFGYVLPENVVTSTQLERELAPVYERFGVHEGRLELMTGIRQRRFWDEGSVPSDGSTQAGRRAMEAAGVNPDQIECLLHTSVSRDCLEPANTFHQHGGLPFPLQMSQSLDKSRHFDLHLVHLQDVSFQE